MKLISNVLVALVLALTVSVQAAGKIRVVATIPELAEFAREIGGGAVEVESLATGVEDTHGIPIKPSFATKLNRADVVILLGLGMEHAFLPALLEAGRNPKLQKGKPGYIDTSKGISPLEIPANLSRSEGDQHPGGNPHYNLDPVLAKVIVQNIYEGLAKAFPENEAAFKTGRDGYLARLDAKIVQWQELAKPLNGVKLVSYHNHWPYFAARYGLKFMGTIELRPGVEPTPKHVKDLIAMIQSEGIKVIVREPQFSEKVPNQLAAQTGAKVAKLAIMSGGSPEVKTYLDLVEYNIRTLLQAVEAK
jgi:zinc/manganese transport system substrate-binding protein